MHSLLCTIVTRQDAAPPPGWRVYVPALDRFEPAVRDMMGVLPVADINGTLIAAAASGVLAGVADAAGVFLVDPFLNLVDLAQRLRAAGIHAVANYPSVQILTGESAAALASVGYGFDAECAALARCRALGLEVIGYAASRKAADALLTAGAGRLVILPGFAAPPGLADEIVKAAEDIHVAHHRPG